ncbi:baseplate assembly protein [Sphingomonas melonis]|uniref:baseplate assembly protein n=1 Tax=Sphingomonas melonis TaxID=152682 RepID=UPI00209C0CB0|nr:baseplate J/gp47 family protein [Sphingomonas melonis]
MAPDMAGAMAATSTTVDLSRLPAPVIVEQLDYETILARKVERIQALLPTFDATVDSDPAMKVLQVCAYDELLLRRAFQDGALQNLVAYATGPALDHLAALVGVTRLIVLPANTTTGAAAVYEDDDGLRQRIVLAPEGFSVAGPELAYVKHAKDARGDILDASATTPAPGEVLITILSATGDGTASAEQLDAVRAIVTAPAIRPLGDHVTVQSAQIIRFAIHARLTTFSGPDPALLLAQARARLDAYLADSRRLDRDITLTGIITATSPAGVSEVEIVAPAARITCSPSEAALCTDIVLDHAGYAQ